MMLFLLLFKMIRILILINIIIILATTTITTTVADAATTMTKTTKKTNININTNTNTNTNTRRRATITTNNINNKNHQYNCNLGCPSKINKVCGSNGITFQNECIALCQGMTISNYNGSCDGERDHENQEEGYGYEFISPESNLHLNNNNIPYDVIHEYDNDDFVFMGTIQAVYELPSEPIYNNDDDDDDPSSLSSNNDNDDDKNDNNNLLLPAIRFTMSGNMYVSKYGTMTNTKNTQDQHEQQQQQQQYEYKVLSFTGEGEVEEHEDKKKKTTATTKKATTTKTTTKKKTKTMSNNNSLFFGNNNNNTATTTSYKSLRKGTTIDLSSSTSSSSQDEEEESGGEEKETNTISSSSSLTTTTKNEILVREGEFGFYPDIPIDNDLLTFPDTINNNNDNDGGDGLVVTGEGIGGGGGGEEETVLGTDSRYPIYTTNIDPYKMIGEFDFWGFGEGGCTGSIVGPNSVVTAAHCVWDGTKFYPVKGFAPGRRRDDGNVGNEGGGTGGIGITVLQFFGAYWEAKDATIYKNFADGRDKAYDVAIVRLHPNLQYGSIGERLGTFPLSSYPCDIRDLQSWIAGYPADLLDGQMYKSDNCKEFYHECLSKRLYHQCDTYGGQSGAAIINTKNEIFGIHTHGGRSWNSGVSFNDLHMRHFRLWIK